MSDTPSLAFNLNLPPEAALKLFRNKGLKTGFSWQDVWKQEHDAAFTVAKMLDVDLLSDVRDAVDAAIANGETLGEFSKKLQPELAKKGWWGRGELLDPLDGVVKEVQLGSPRRLQTIFRVNMQMAYAAADRIRYEETKESAPYLMYDAVDDNRVRPQHRAWDGTVLPGDDPWWHSHNPPNGYNCRCGTIQLSTDDLRAMGKEPDAQAPPIFRREFTNRRTGEISNVPDGIDPGFDYAPGASRVEYLNKILDEKTQAFRSK